MSVVTKVVMDKDDLQPLADAVKNLKGIPSTTKLSLKDMEDEINNTSSIGYKTCKVNLIINQPATGAGYYFLKDGEPEYRTLCLPMSITQDIYDQIGSSIGLDKVIVGSTLWVGYGTYTGIVSNLQLSGLCEAINGTTQPGSTYGELVKINGDCTIIWG